MTRKDYIFIADVLAECNNFIDCIDKKCFEIILDVFRSKFNELGNYNDEKFVKSIEKKIKNK